MLQGARGIVIAIAVLAAAGSSEGQSEFENEQIPDEFSRGQHYPSSSEEEVCRPIVDHIDRNSARFNIELTVNSNPGIVFEDSVYTSSRMKTSLDELAELYRDEYGSSETFAVTKAWSQFPDADLTGDDRSLHYEGRTVEIRVPRVRVSVFLTLAIDAAVNWVIYESDISQGNSLVRLSVIPDDCQNNVDLVFMLDQSGSVGRTNHDIAKQFIINVLQFFTIGLASTRVGLVAYSGSSHVEFVLDDYTTQQEVEDAIDAVGYRGGNTATALALNDTREILDPSNNYGARPNVDGIPKIGILLTDGKSNGYPLTYAAPSLKAAGVQVYTVGIGSIDVDELRFISSDPDEDHVFLLSSFRDAAGFVSRLSVITCGAAAITEACQRRAIDIENGGIRYFQTSCSEFTDTVTVEVRDTVGTNFLYCSATELNPGPLTANTVSSESPGPSVRSCTVTVTDAKVLYIGVQGQDSTNSFEMFVWDPLFDFTEVSITVLDGPGGRDVYDVSQHLLPAASGITFDYSITDGNVEDSFSIGLRTGQLRVEKALDFNVRPTFSLSIAATNAAANCHCTQIRLNIQIQSTTIDFEPVAPVEVSEFAATGSSVATIQASGGVGSIRYSITEGNSMGRFAIDPVSGVIEVAAELDYETQQSYSLTLRAVSQGTTVEGTIGQIINVLDENESPFFTQNCAINGVRCFGNVDEGLPMGSPVRSILAMDPDLSSVPNGMLEFSIPSSDPFSIDSSGLITTTEVLDREATTPPTTSYQFLVAVRDMGSPFFLISISVRIRVNDIDDNPPVFVDPPATLTVDENVPNQFVVHQYTATDIDSGTNAEITFSLTSDDPVPFTSSDEGALTVIGAIDYEVTTSYTVTITATSGGGQSASVTTTINVVDLNDNAPVFSQDPYTGSVVEHSSTGLTIRTVSATDEDSGTNGEIVYSIISTNAQGLLSIDAGSGEISVASDIDRERIPELALTVRAADLGMPTLSSTATVTITVSDINDNAPIFDPDLYSAAIMENIGVPFDVLSVFASDLDEPQSPNSMVTYSITEGNVGTTFSLDAVSGQLTLMEPLDFETLCNYSLTVVASDGGIPRRSDTATVSIAVINVNEDPPELSGDQAVDISELAPLNSIVARFTATDLDANTVITFTLLNAGGVFSLPNVNDGTITLVQPLDFETTESYTVTVSASDGDRTSDAELTVNVIDENEFTPEFTSGLSFEVNEEMMAGTPVGTVEAQDGDGSEPNSRVTFSFGSGETLLQYFTLDSESGEIRTKSVLDREKLTDVFPPSSGSLRSAEVTARDGGSPSLQARATITITLVDINDNTPIFVEESYSNSFLENLPMGTTVFQLSAMDADIGTNADITYSFTELSGNDGLFTLDADSGLLTTSQTLDCEFQAYYNFSLTASDGGDPTMSNTTDGTLVLIDENDNSPEFDRPIYELTLYEDYQVGRPVEANISAHDPDKGLNGQITYAIFGQITQDISETPEETATIFVIDSDTGVVTHVTPFNYENDRVVMLTLAAIDMGLPRRSGTAQLVITVLNIDESAPTFAGDCSDVVNIPEDSPVTGATVIHCIATDSDNISTADTQDMAIVYSIRNDDTMTFDIDSATGEVSLAKSLDRETQSVYDIVIAATDLVGQTGFFSVQIRVVDVNDNSPQFDSDTYQVSVSDIQREQSQRTALQTVRATDPDDGLNGDVEYSISSRSSSGDVTTIVVTASDRGSPPSNTSAMVTVTLNRDCPIQEYSIDEGLGVLYGSFLCSVDLSTEDEVVVENDEVEFTCNIVSNVDPVVTFIRDGGSATLPSSDVTYTLESVNVEDSGDYACRVSTSIGSLQSTATSLTVYADNDVVQIDLSDIDQPSSDGTCQIFDETSLQNALSGSRQATMVTSISSSGVLCESTPCSPSPCERGTCELDDASPGGYECTCYDGFSGVNCSSDINECLESPCENAGTCVNIVGFYDCTCAAGFTGHRCQYSMPCDVTSCPADQFCIQTIVSGHICQEINRTSSLIVSGLNLPNEGFLNDFVISLIEQLQQTNTRRKRQQPISQSLISCVHNFVEIESDVYALHWVCPPSVSPPSTSDLDGICEQLLQDGLVETCKPPNGMELMRPTMQPLPPATVTIEIVQVDRGTNMTIDAADVLDNIEDSLDEYAESAGVTVDNVEATVPITCTPQCENGDCTGRDECTCDDGYTGDRCQEGIPQEADNTPIIVGVVVAVVLLIIIIVAVIVAVFLYFKLNKRHVKKQKAKKQYANELAVLSNPHTQPGPDPGLTVSPPPPLMVAGSQTNLIEETDANDYDMLEAFAPQRPPKPTSQADGASRESSIYQNVQKLKSGSRD